MDYTHEIIKLERTTTKGSQSPMWRCTTQDGQTVNIFQHKLPERDTCGLMLLAGYAAFTEMEVGEVQRWTTYPIKVQLVMDGQYWKLAAVEPRPKFAEADADWMPDVSMYQERAQRLSRILIGKVVQSFFIDFETTGVEKEDEIVAASVIKANGQVVYDELLLPKHPEKLLRPGKHGKTASEINGITPDMLTNATLVEDAIPFLAMILTGRIWVIYNAPFDVGVLERECLAYKHPLINAMGIHDTMTIFAEYLGDWQPKTQSFRNVTLSEAARLLDIDPGESNTAKADALTMLHIVKAMAIGKPVKDGV